MRCKTTRSAGDSPSRRVTEHPAPVQPATIATLLADAGVRLAATSDSPRLDAELLLGHVLGVGRERLVIDRTVVVDDESQAHFARLVDRRAGSEPIAYILGHQAFRWLDLTVDSRVLVPRPESELLVEIGLTLPRGASVVDVGTGSGAIALALKQERPDLDVAGLDVSSEALAVAIANARTLSLDVNFSVSDLLEARTAPADAVLANLPYIEHGAPLPDDVARWEPSLALFGGDDGLTLIRRLVAAAGVQTWPALLALEIGEQQGTAASALVRAAGFGEVTIQRDLAGRDRVVVGRR
jgi:release factor glutamine methyltransferase